MSGVREPDKPAYSMVWQRLQSCEMTLPGFVRWLSSWHRKHPGNGLGPGSLWPTLFAYEPHVTFIVGNTFRSNACFAVATARLTASAGTPDWSL